MLDTLLNFIHGSGFGQVTIGNLIMIGIGLVFITLAIKKGFEPLLLVPIGFGMLIGNIPYNVTQISLSVYDGPVSEHLIRYVAGKNPVTINGIEYAPWTELPNVSPVRDLAYQVKDDNAEHPVYMVNREDKFTFTQATGPGVYALPKGGHHVFVPPDAPPGQTSFQAIVQPRLQDTWNASVLWFLYRGIAWGFYPPLIFLGVGALIDFGPLLANPRMILLGAAAQFGIFGAMLMALFLDFSVKESASIGIIGGADGPTAIFTCTMLAPHLLGAVALAAYSYMAMVPIIQPPIMRALTTREERLIRMEAPKDVSKRTRILFPIAAFLLTAFIANGALPLLGMLFLGNLLRESMVTDRLAKTAQTTFIDIVTILLGLTVGAKTQASNFLTLQTIGIFMLGIVAFAVATASGVLFAKFMNLVSKQKINPLIGAAGVSAVPMSARVVQKVAHQEDPQNFLLMHAMGPNVAGVIGSAVAAGVLLSKFAGQ